MCNGMRVTCRFLRDALNAVVAGAALTWSFIEDDSREYLSLVGYSCIPKLRNI